MLMEMVTIINQSVKIKNTSRNRGIFCILVFYNISFSSMRFFLTLLVFVMSFSQIFAYELTLSDKSLLNAVMPKFYEIIERGEDDTA